MKYKILPSVFIIIGGFYVTQAQTPNSSLPHLVQKDGRHALIVDGEPFLVLGAQCNNSSAWPATLPEVWSAMKKLHVNTLEIPVYWEQFEPRPGHYDTGLIDTIITQARQKNVRLILLWFGTWKNGSNHYMPQWMKLQPDKYPNIIGKDGKQLDSPSPHSRAALETEIEAFSAFMGHLKEFDLQRTVIMVQLENEPGSWGTVRDFSKKAQKIFDAPVPAEVLAAMGISPLSNRGWEDVFGKDADEYFQVWHVASYIGQVATAGKAVYPIPLYVNGSVRNPGDQAWLPTYQVGGPNDNVFELWKAAAPAVDILSPDIYFRQPEKYLKVLELYDRPDNPLFIPETIWQEPYPKYCYAALGHGAVGYAPFGLDDTRLRIGKDGLPLTAEKMYGPTAINYKLFNPMSREIARLNFEGRIQTAIQLTSISPDAERGNPVDQENYVTDQTLPFENWDADIAFGAFDRMSRSEFQPETPDGRVLIAELGKNQYLLVGYHCRVIFRPAGENDGRNGEFLIVEEGHYADGVFQADRILNGDQTDWGLNFDEPKILRVALYTR